MRIFASALIALLPYGAAAQEAVGNLDLTMDGEERSFILVQGGEGANPGSRYSRVGGDVVLTLVAVLGDEPVEPTEAEETVELRFTVAEAGSEVRTGSILSHSRKDAQGVLSTRGGTTEVALDELTSDDQALAAAGTFTTQLPPDDISAGTEIEGSFRASMKSREALEP